MANVSDEMAVDAVLPNNEENDQSGENDDDGDEEITPGEYAMLDAKLDDLNIALDLIEQKNDKIRAEFLKLLHSNQEIREEFKQELQNQPTDSNPEEKPAKDNNNS